MKIWLKIAPNAVRLPEFEPANGISWSPRKIMVKDLRQRSGLPWFCTCAESCVVFNTGPYTVLPDNSILITANMQSETGFPSSHQLKSYIASKSHLTLMAHTVLSADAGLLVQNGSCLLFWILNIPNFGTPRVETARVRHVAKFREDRWNRWWVMAIFQNGSHLLCHLEFLKTGICNCVYSSEGQCVSICKISCWLIKPFLRCSNFLKIAGVPPSWICYVHVWTTHDEYLMVFITVQNVVGINAVVVIICQCSHLTSLTPKCIFTPSNWVFWGFYPLSGEQSQHDPQMASSCAEVHHTMYRPLRSIYPVWWCILTL